jgi:transposase
MPRGKAISIQLSKEERDALERYVRRRKSAHSLAQRSRIVLLASEGLTDRAIAERVGLGRDTVGIWRNRFARERLAGLRDEPRRGRPRKIGDEHVKAVVATTLETKPQGATHWSTRRLAQKVGLSQSAVSRILRAFGLQPHRGAVPELSADVGKVRDIVGLYLCPPRNAAVFCVDKKTAAQALKQSHPVPPLPPQQLERRPHDAFCYGSPDLLAALNDATGEMYSQTRPRHRRIELFQFLDAIDEQVPLDLGVHVVLDHLSTHRVPQVKRGWLQRHPRFHLHVSPTHASWLNEVERWFAGLSDTQLRRETHRPQYELRTAIESYGSSADRAAEPFVWVKSADQIVGDIALLAQRTLGFHGGDA